MNGTSVPTAIMYRVFDAFLQAPQKDWSGELLKIIKAAQQQAEAVEEDRIGSRERNQPVARACQIRGDLHKRDVRRREN